ncbi:MAG: hypothetical protein AAB364_02680 [Patescibacteria group bacterium]
MSAEKFYKVIAILAAITAIVWIGVYYVSNYRDGAPAPAPAASEEDAEEARRAQLLQSLRATEPTSLTEAERAALLKGLKSSKPTKLTDADREKLLESLKAQ